MEYTDEQLQEISFLIDEALYAIAEAKNMPALDISSLTLARLMIINAAVGSLDDFRRVCLAAAEHGMDVDSIDLDGVTLQ